MAALTELQVDDIRAMNNGLIAYDMSSLKRDVPNPVLTFEQAFKEYPEILERIQAQNFLVSNSPISYTLNIFTFTMIDWLRYGGDSTDGYRQNSRIPSARSYPHGWPLCLRARRVPGYWWCVLRELASEVKKFKFRGFNSVCVYGGGDRSLQR